MEDLVSLPHESLNVELKGWLNTSNAENKAVLAQAMLALGNFGGGYILLGFSESGGAWVTEEPRPSSLEKYSQDLINGIVKSYAEPDFHCEVRQVKNRVNSDLHPVVIVPGGQVPIRAKRDGPNHKHVRINTYYTRRPGPTSEAIQTGEEWDTLIHRCSKAAMEEWIAEQRALLFSVEQPKVKRQERLLIRATATIDYPILAGSGVNIRRTIRVTNPIGNAPINSIAVSIPKGVTDSTPSGAFPQDSGTVGACSVETLGSGPWAIVYSSISGRVLVPSGGSIKLTLSFKTRLTTAKPNIADIYMLSVSASSGTMISILPSITVYETSSTSVYVTDPSCLRQLRNQSFRFQARTTQSGLPLVATVTIGKSSEIVLSPTSFTTGLSPSWIEMKAFDTGMLIVIVSGGGDLSSNSSGGILVPGQTKMITIES